MIDRVQPAVTHDPASRGSRTHCLIALVLALSTLPSCADASQNTRDKPTTPSTATGTFQGDRTIIGTVQHVSGEQIEVDIGEMQPLYLPLKQAREKGITSIKPGDKLRIELNDQNLLVDFYPVDHKSVHRIVKGRIAQPLLIGHDEVVIRTESGREEMFAIRPAARSKMASLQVGSQATFLLDETKQVADVRRDQGQDAHRANLGRKSPPKGAHQHIQGMIVEALKDDMIRIRTENGREMQFEVRPMAQDRLNKMHPGQVVILLIDTDDKVIDVAHPAGRG